MKMPNMAAAIMPPNTGVPTACRVNGAGTGRDDQRHQAEDEGEARHHHRAEAQAPQPRSPQASMSLPSARCSTAKATIRMPFLAASAISTTNPICA